MQSWLSRRNAGKGRWATLMMCFSGSSNVTVPGEHVKLMQINGVFVRGWGGTGHVSPVAMPCDTPSQLR
jgi:hypothetical protein